MKVFLAVVFCATALLFAGCATMTQPAGKVTVGNAAPLPPYSGLMARVAVGDFEVKGGKVSASIGSGLRSMLITALGNSSRFSIVERPVPGKELPKQPDLVVTVSVAEFEPQASGGAAGVGGGGGVGSGMMGGLLGVTLNKAHMALDIRITTTAASELLATTRVQGQASDLAGGFMAGFFGGWALGDGLTAYANTPMEKAIRICIIEAIRYISQSIPEDYYKY